jgi:hypothetical protein
MKPKDRADRILEPWNRNVKSWFPKDTQKMLKARIVKEIMEAEEQARAKVKNELASD